MFKLKQKNNKIETTNNLNEHNDAAAKQNTVCTSKITFTEEMEYAKKQILSSNKQIIWIYGAAGTGKTFFLKHILQYLPKGSALVAPTGAAALLIDGSTIHKFFHLPIIKNPSVYMPHDDEYYNEHVKREALDSWDSTNFLIIDEVSMVRADVFDEINRRMKIAKENDLPFGGVKLLLLGDPYQLPPVLQEEDKDAFYNLGYKTPYFFSSVVFKELLQNKEIEHIEFTKVFRQKDEHFLGILNNIRLGRHTISDLENLNNRKQSDLDNKSLIITTTRKEANSINQAEYDKIDSEEKTYIATATKSYLVDLSNALKSNNPNDYIEFPAVPVLKLKVGTRILLLVNENNYVNGTIATVTELHDDYIEAKENDITYRMLRHVWEDKEYVLQYGENKLMTLGTYCQFPIAYGWALTIHKAQGKTIDKISVSFANGAFAPGQAYVALSRVKEISGLNLITRVRQSDIKECKSVNEYFKYCKNHELL